MWQSKQLTMKWGTKRDRMRAVGGLSSTIWLRLWRGVRFGTSSSFVVVIFMRLGRVCCEQAFLLVVTLRHSRFSTTDPCASETHFNGSNLLRCTLPDFKIHSPRPPRIKQLFIQTKFKQISIFLKLTRNEFF